MEKQYFGTDKNGNEIFRYTLTDENGNSLSVLNYGATIQSLVVTDKNGVKKDVVLGFDNLAQYENNTDRTYFGAVVGRVANRIGGGKFTLEGVDYTTPQNNNGQTLHGGLKGLDMVVWNVLEVTDSSIRFGYTAPDGQDGFPGNLTIVMDYILTENDEFKVSYSATTDKTTVVNLSHHSFFNLKGEAGGTITDHILQIDADYITPTDANLIPTGELLAVEGTPFDFRTAHAIGDMIDADNEQLKNGRGYDMNWVLSRENNGEVVKVMSIYEPQSGRGFEVYTDQPALQFYSGNFFDGSYDGKYGKPLAFRESVVFETQKYPDAVNHSSFPSVVLTPGEEYTHTCIYKFVVKR